MLQFQNDPLFTNQPHKPPRLGIITYDSNVLTISHFKHVVDIWSNHVNWSVDLFMSQVYWWKCDIPAVKRVGLCLQEFSMGCLLFSNAWPKSFGCYKCVSVNLLMLVLPIIVHTILTISFTQASFRNTFSSIIEQCPMNRFLANVLYEVMLDLKLTKRNKKSTCMVALWSNEKPFVGRVWAKHIQENAHTFSSYSYTLLAGTFILYVFLIGRP